MLLLPGADERRRAASQHRAAQDAAHDSASEDGNPLGKKLEWIAGIIAVWYSIQLVRSFFSESGAELIVDFWLLGQYVVSYLLLKRLSGSEPVDGTIQWLARLWIVPTIGVLALFIWGLSGGGLLYSIRTGGVTKPAWRVVRLRRVCLPARLDSGPVGFVPRSQDSIRLILRAETG